MTASKLILRAAFGALACATAFRAAAAQGDTTALQVGARGRITAPSIQPMLLVGHVTALDTASLTVRVWQDHKQVPVQVPFSAITRAERSIGRHRAAWVWAGAGLGLVGGVASGVLVATHTSDGALAPVGFGFYGMLGGAITGALAAPERWQPAILPRPK